MQGLDYAVVAAYLAGAIGLGIWFGRGQSRSEFFAANHSMGRITVGLSVMATLFSSNSFVMYPSIAYGDSLRLSLTLVSQTLIAPVVIWVLIPVYAKLKCATAYEYLEHRFHVSVRCLASGLFILLRIGWMASATFAASLVVAGVSGLDQRLVIMALGVVSILYTMMGGLRAVMWTDVIQFFIFAVTILAALAILQSFQDRGFVGQFETYFQDRDNLLFDFTPSVTLKFGSWAILIGIFLEALSAFGTDQVAVQRYIAAKSPEVSQSGFLINVLGIWIVIPALLMIGVGLFCHYQAKPEELIPQLSQHVAEDLASEQPAIRRAEFGIAEGAKADVQSVANFYRNNVKRVHHDMARFGLSDKALPFFVGRHFPAGLKGLFLAALMAAIMSSIDSGVHSITTALIVDFRDRLFPSKKARRDQDDVRTIRWLIVLIGSITVCLACFVGSLGDVFDIGKKLTAAFGGPLLAVFILGLFVKRCSSRGVFAGALLSALTTGVLMYYCSHWFSVWFWPVGFALAMMLSLLFSAIAPADADDPLTFRKIRRLSDDDQPILSDRTGQAR
jgi:Na+/proline symporter